MDHAAIKHSITLALCLAAAAKYLWALVTRQKPNPASLFIDGAALTAIVFTDLA